ncbi:hypothetical protein D5038_07455 [Verminephrobacter aporrectodeae subsp. tuberculatae]|uniref:SwmB domain-containing protein n=2 Tax=Verminephrobacter aporrectodeae TaxID=1110389 RepID=UPI002238FD65|nr:SwmB domain-containing protein [Verminephrobacter aporrectodeae]MCW5256189.1 hypothetical protein [Verminephrobacter aporrectodeae subsp. tuberculatae]
MNTDSHTSPSLRSGETTNTGGTRLPTLAATNPITIADNKLSLGESTTVTIRFAEAIATNSFTTADLTVGGSAKLSNLRSTDDGTTWTVTLTAPGQEDLQPPLFDSSRYNSTGNQISVNLAGVTNPAGNAGVGQAVSTVTYDIDVWAPSATITLGDSALTAGETTTVTISFVEPVTGFTAANIDLSRTSGTLGPLTALGDGRTWTVTFTPAANTNAAANSIGVRGITDLAGNTSNVFFSDNYSIDTRPGSTNQTSDLSARVTLADSRLTTGEKATVIIAFNKPVTSSSFTIDDVDMTHANGTLSDLTLSADSRTWTATFTPTANVIAESNTISVNLAGVTDAAGTAGTGSATSGNFIVNTAPIAATITLADTALTAGETTTVTFSFNQAVMGFMMDDIDLTQANGTLSELVYTSNSGNKTWTTTFTPKADVSGATNTIRVNLTGVANMAGRSGTGTADSANYTVDTRPQDATAPVINSAMVNGNQLVLTYTEANTLDPAALAGSAGFTVSSTTGTAITVSGAVVHATDKTVTLTLSRAVTPAETVKVSYTKPASGAVVQDAAGNDAVSFSEQAVTNNSPPAAGGTRLPTLAATNPITIADDKLSIGESTTVTIRFAEAIATDSFTTDDLRVSGSATLSNLRSTDGGTTWTVTLTAPGRSVLNDLSFSRYNSTGNQISVDLTGVTNPAGNAGVGQAVSTVTYDIDVFSPGVSITLGDNALTAGETTTVTFSFSEPVNGFTAANIDLSQAHGALGPLTALGDGRSWTATFTPTADTNTATNSIRVNYRGVTDLAGNTANSTSPSDNYSIDTRPGSTAQPSDLSARVTLTNSHLMTGEKAIVIVAFNKPVNGFTLDDVDMTGANGTLSDLALSADGRTWTATFTPTAGVNDATNTIRVNLAGVTYGAGTAGTGSATSDNFRVDTALPAATITLADTALTVGETTTVTFAFNQSANGFTMDDIDLTQANGTLSALTTADGKTWTATLTPTANVNNASNTIRVNQAGVTNDAGRSGTGTASSANYTVDTRPQDATAPVINSAMVNGNQLVLTYTEANTLDPAALAGSAGFTVSSTTGTAITVSGAVVHATDKTVTLTLSRAVTPAETVKVSYTKPASGAVVQDAAGNDAVSFSEQAVTNNSPPAAGGTRLPTLAATNPITIADDKLSLGESTTVTIRFAEAIATDSFTTDDLRVSGYATLSNLRSTDGGTTWTVTLTAPTARDIWATGYYNPGKYSSTGNQISVNLTGVTNPAGNAGVGQVVSTVTYDIDAIAPTVAITLGDSALTTGETTTVTISFNEPVTGFDADDIDLTQAHGTLGPLTALTDGRTWTATFTPTANTNVAENKIIVKLDGVTDLAGNKASANVISTSSNYSINTQPGSTDQTTGLSASVTLTDDRLTTGEKATVIIAFNKPVNDFTLDDVDGTRAHGTLSDLTRSADGRTWTATFTPTAGVIAETNTISVNLAGVTYAAGTASTAGTGRTTSDNFIVHTALPAATITLADTALTAGETTTVTFRFNQVVFGFTMDDIVLDTATGTLGALTTTDNQTWTATLTPKADVSAATNTIRVNLTGVANVAGRSSTGTADSANYTVDTRLPDATPPAFSSAAVNGSQLVLTYTEANTLDPAALAGSAGFTVSSTTGTAITVSGAVVHATDKTVTLTLSRAVTPAETVKVSYTKPASGAVVQDAAGNDAVSFSEQAVTNNTPSGTADTTPPQLITTGHEYQFPTVNRSGEQLLLTFSDTSNLDENHMPAARDFTVRVDGDLRTVSSVTMNATAKIIFLVLATPVAAGQRVTVAYQDSTPTDTEGNGIQDTAGNRLDSFPATEAVNSVLDTGAPQLITTGAMRPTASGNQLVLSFSDANGLSVDPARKPATGDFAVLVAGVANAVTAVAVDGAAKTVTLTLTTAVTPGQTATVAYADSTPNDISAIQDAQGNRLTGFAATEVNTTPDTTPPVFSSAAVNGTQLVITYTEANSLDAAALAGSAGFTVSSTTGTAITVSSAVVHATNKTVTLTLSRAVTPAETVKVSYTKPASGAVVQDAAGNDAVSFSDQAVTNNTSTDTTPPRLITTGTGLPTLTGDVALVIRFSDTSDLDEDLDHAPASGDFTVLLDGARIAVRSVTVDGRYKYIQLVLDTPITPRGKSLTIAYQDSTPTGGKGIQDIHGNRLDSFLAAEVFDNTTDIYGPQLITTGAKRPTASGNQLVLSFSDANNLSVDPTRKPVTGDFTVRVAGVANAVTAVAVDGAAKTITLTLTTAVTPGQTTTVAYADSTPNDISAIQDAQGNRLTGFAATEVNTTPDTTPPVFSSAAVNGTQLVLTYTEANTLDPAALPGNAGFTVSSTTGTAITVSGAVVDATAKTVTLTLSRAVTHAETVKVSYTKPASGAVVQDAAGNDATNLSEQAVTNNTPNPNAPQLLTTGIHRPALDGSTIFTIRFSATSNLDERSDHAPAKEDFKVFVDGVSNTVRGVVVSGPQKNILLELTTPVVAGQRVTVAYQDSTPNDDRGIRDTADNRLASFQTTDVFNNALDNVPPQLITTGATRPTASGNQLVLSFRDTSNLHADLARKPATGDFTVRVADVANAVTAVAVNATDKTITLTLTTAVTPGQTATVAYTDSTPDDTSAIQDERGNRLTGFAATEVNTPDNTAPVFNSAAVNGDQLVITYTEANTLDPAALAGNAGFTVSSSTGTAITVSGAVVHATDKTVTLTLSRAVTPAETVKVSYTKPASGAVVQDAAGNDAVSFSEQAVTNTSPPAGGGTQRPTLAATNPITIADDKLSIGESTTVTIRFAEAIATDSFTIADLTVGGYATLANDLRSTDGGITWTVTLKAPTMQDLFAPEGFGSGKYNSTGNQIRVNLAGVTNLAGNAGVGQAVSTVTYDIDTIAPGVTIRLGDTVLTPGETTTVTFSFNEPVTGFDADDIDLTRANGTLGPLTAIGDDRRTWTATFTPAANVNDAENKIRVRSDGVADLAGNGTSTSVSSNYTIDTRPGTTGQTSGLSASVTLTDDRLTTGEKAIVIIAFNKPVNGFTLDDVDATHANGTLSDLILSADGRTWTATFTPTAGVIAESNTISVNLAGVTDAAGTAATGSATSDNFIVNTALPAATITLTDTALTAGETTTVTFTFNQVVIGFTIDDIDLTQANGTLSALTYAANKTWTATFTPDANVSAATNTIRVNLTGVANVAGRSSTGTASSANYTVDTRVPDTTAPQLITTGATSPKVTGDQLVLSFNDTSNLDADPDHKPANGAFTVLVNGVANTVTHVTVQAQAKTVTLTLTTAVTHGQSVTVAYTDPTTGNDTNAIQNAAGHDVASFAATGVVNNTPAATDTTPPAFSSAAVNGTQLVLTYTEANTLDAAALAGNAGFTVSSTTGTAITVSGAVVHATDKTVTLTLSRAVTPAETVKVNYTKPASGAVVQDAAGNDAVSFSEQAVTNNTPAAPAAPEDTTPPAFSSAAVNGTQLVLTYTEANTLDAAALAGNAGFTVSSTTGTAITVSGAVVHATNKTVTLTLSRAVTPTETVKVNYTKPASGAVVQDAAGNDAVSFSDQAVTNNTPAAPAAPTDNTAPVFNSAAVNGDQLVISYTEANTLDAAALAGNAGFTVSSSTGTAITVSSAVVNATAKTVTLTLSRAVTNAETVKLSYTKPASGAVVQDAAGNDAVSFSSQAVTNNTPAQADTRPPEFIDASVNGNQLELHYADANHLNANHSVPASAFALSSPGAAAISVSDVAVTGKTVTLTLSRAVANGEKLTLSYTKPATGDNAVQDAAGNAAADLHNQAVNNFTPAPAPAPGPGPAPAPTPEHDPGAPNADHDGVPDAQENQAIGPKGSAPGDGNNDGIQDSAQAAVASFSAKTSSGSGTSVTLVADSQGGKVPLGSTTRITSLEQKAAPAQTPKALETPIALTSFKATLETAGSTETFSLYVDPKIGANGYWLQDHSGTWVNLASSPYGGKMVDEGGRLRLDFTITDGGAFDADGQANGSITAPGAAAKMPLSIVGQAPDGTHGGFWL